MGKLQTIEPHHKETLSKPPRKVFKKEQWRNRQQFQDSVDFLDAELHHCLLAIAVLLSLLPIVRLPLLLNPHPIVDHAALLF